MFREEAAVRENQRARSTYGKHQAASPLYLCIFAYTPVKKKEKKRSKKKGGKTRKWGWGDGKGGEISGWKGGRVISKKDGGKDGRV